LIEVNKYFEENKMTKIISNLDEFIQKQDDPIWRREQLARAEELLKLKFGDGSEDSKCEMEEWYSGLPSREKYRILLPDLDVITTNPLQLKWLAHNSFHLDNPHLVVFAPLNLESQLPKELEYDVMEGRVYGKKMFRHPRFPSTDTHKWFKGEDENNYSDCAQIQNQIIGPELIEGVNGDLEKQGINFALPRTDMIRVALQYMEYDWQPIKSAANYLRKKGLNFMLVEKGGDLTSKGFYHFVTEDDSGYSGNAQGEIK
jgi:hypothetical protein